MVNIENYFFLFSVNSVDAILYQSLFELVEITVIKKRAVDVVAVEGVVIWFIFELAE